MNSLPPNQGLTMNLKFASILKVISRNWEDQRLYLPNITAWVQEDAQDSWIWTLVWGEKLWRRWRSATDVWSTRTQFPKVKPILVANSPHTKKADRKEGIVRYHTCKEEECLESFLLCDSPVHMTKNQEKLNKCKDKLEQSWAKLSLGLASGYLAYEVAS